MIGTTVHHYKITKLINEGGMGAVYLASHSQSGQKAAVKVLKPHLASQGSFKQRFLNEAKIMEGLKHPNLVSLYHYEENAQGLFMIMEYVEGKSLQELLQSLKSPLTSKEALALFNQVLDGFAYAHQQNLVHRDVKPANVMLSKEMHVKILDFGIAKALDRDSEMTTTGMQMGTLKYMSPEQVHDSKHLDHRSDIYSLGVTLFNLLANQTPYDNMESRLDVQIAIAKDPLPDVRQLNPSVAPHLAQAIIKATAKRPEERFQSCEAFKATINQQIFKTPSSPKSPSIDSEAQTIISDFEAPSPKTELAESEAPTIITPAANSKSTKANTEIESNKSETVSTKQTQDIQAQLTQLEKEISQKKGAPQTSSKPAPAAKTDKKTAPKTSKSKTSLLPLILVVLALIAGGVWLSSTSSSSYTPPPSQTVSNPITGVWQATEDNSVYRVSLDNDGGILLAGTYFSGKCQRVSTQEWEGLLQHNQQANLEVRVKVYLNPEGAMIIHNFAQNRDYYHLKQ